MADSKVEVLNNYPGHFAALRRTRESGKQRVTIEVKSEAIGVNTDERAIAMMVADAVAEDIRRRIRDVGTFAKAATQLYRKRAREAFDRGASWAKKQYGGGRIGPMAPNQTSRDLNDSGRLAKSVVAQFTRDVTTAVINVAANRLSDPRIYAATWPKLEPIIRAAMSGEAVREAGVKMAKELLKKGRLSAKDQRRELVDKLGQTIEKFSQLGQAVEDFTEE